MQYSGMYFLFDTSSTADPSNIALWHPVTQKRWLRGAMVFGEIEGNIGLLFTYCS